VDRVSNGRGVVSTLELADLAELDFGSWKDMFADYEDPEEPDANRSGVLTLQHLLELVADAERPLELAVETKHPTRYAGLVERRLVELLDRFGWAHPRLGARSPVRVMSFSYLSLRRIRRLAPSLETVYLMERVPLRLRPGSLPVGIRTAGVSIEVVRQYPQYVARAHASGHPVHVFTVNHMSDVDRCVEAGVDGIITDRPLAVLRQLGR
jgi:glycerophosphoryl diester phosphodiesterase